MRPPAGRTGPESRRRTARAYTTSTVRLDLVDPKCRPEPLFPGISERVPLASPQLALSKEGELDRHPTGLHTRRGPPAAASRLWREGVPVRRYWRQSETCGSWRA